MRYIEFSHTHLGIFIYFENDCIYLENDFFILYKGSKKIEKLMCV